MSILKSLSKISIFIFSSTPGHSSAASDVYKRQTCMNMLKARLYDYEIKKREEENQNVESSKSEIGWGHQIRSYVLQPYRLVKDNRTSFESTSPDKVLDGDIDEFLEQSLYKLNEK